MDPLLDHAPCGFLTFRDDGCVEAVNRTLLDLLDYQRPEIEGRHVEALFTVAGRIFYQTHFFPLLKLQGEAREIYLTLRAQDGRAVPVLTNAVRRERAGAFVSDCVLLPIHEREKFEAELLKRKKSAEEASAAKARFLSMMSHDLRTPLNAIDGFVEILAMGLHGPITDAQRQDLERIKAASSYLLRLIDDILAFARVEAGRIQLEMQDVPLAAAVGQAVALVEHSIREAGLTCERSDCDRELRAQADPERLQQILLNLLSNAVKFTPRGGRITVECAEQDGVARVHVRDTGQGIPEERVARIFEPFVQARGASDQPGGKGVGLGLAISQELARAMGGDLSVESTVGVGSVFTLALRASRPEA